MIGRTPGGCFVGCLLRKLLGGPGVITQLIAEAEVEGSGQPEQGLPFQLLYPMLLGSVFLGPPQSRVTR